MQQPTQAPPPPAQPTPPTPPVAPAPAPQPPKKSSALKWVLIIILVIVIIIILAFAGCWFVGRKALKTIEEEAAKVTEQFPGITIPEEVTEGEEVTLPSADVTGKDITGIPRYSGSVRTAWSKDESSETVSYQVKATVAKVKDYYTKLLAEKGWTLASSTEFILDFDKEPAHCTIILYDTDGSTTYSISYWPEW